MTLRIDTSTKYCPMCNIVPTKLVPLYDHDQKHEKTMCCVKCKRKIKKGEDIIKVKRDGDNTKIQLKVGQRTEVKPK